MGSLQINTEQSYVRELQSIIDFYIRPFEAPENEHLIGTNLRERSDVLFGNIPDLVCLISTFQLNRLKVKRTQKLEV